MFAPAIAATTMGLGLYLIYSQFVLKKSSSFPLLKSNTTKLLLTSDAALRRKGMTSQILRKIILSSVALFFGGSLIGWLLFSGYVAPLMIGVFACTVPTTMFAKSIADNKAKAAQCWPSIIEDIRISSGSLGKPLPQALFLAGKRGPQEFREAFENAERDWLLSTDFSFVIKQLKHELADPTADMTLEALLIAHKIGGSQINDRLAVLAVDRRIEIEARKEALAKQAGVRFARRFVLLVPIGMALAGITIGSGRAAYATTEGQLGVAIALTLLGLCWWWSGSLIKLPEQKRVFSD